MGCIVRFLLAINADAMLKYRSLGCVLFDGLARPVVRRMRRHGIALSSCTQL